MQLIWSKADDYHIRSACGRFSVCRVNVTPDIVYVAWKRGEPADELGYKRLPVTATPAERSDAIRAMQRVCETST